MTKHREIEELIQKCLDREISVDENINLQLHLSQCSDCQLFYDELMSIENGVIGMDQLVPNNDFNSRVLARVNIKRAASWAKIAVGAGIAWLCSTLILIFSGLGSDIFGRVLTSTPSVVRFVDKAEFIIATLGRTLSPIVRNQFNPITVLVVLGISIGMFFLFGKFIVKRETAWTA